MNEDNTYTVNINDYVCDTIDISSISPSTITVDTNSHYNSGYSIDWQNVKSLSPEEKEKRTDVRDNGSIPVDIWAKMYNNGVIDD